MLSDKQVKEKFYHCFSDLQRSASSYYFNPQGKNHLIFLKHAQKILKGINNQKAKTFSKKISSLVKQTSVLQQSKTNKINLADKILTLGCLIK